MGTVEVRYYDIVTTIWEPGCEMWQFKFNCPQNLVGNDTIRRCDFDGMGMALLEEEYLCEAFFDVSYAQNTIWVLSLLPVSCKMQDPQLQHCVFLDVTILPSMMIMDEPWKL